MQKVILVTGASSGFGQQIATELAAKGHRVFGTSRNPKGDSDGVRMLQLDVTDDASAKACVDALLKEAGRLDVLVNNAGSGLTGAIEHCSMDEIRWQMETNFFGAIRMVQLALAAMRTQGQGRVITVGSLAGHAALPYQGFYSASKHALEAINEALRLELRGTGIDSTIICPGDFNTGFTDARVFSKVAHPPHHEQQMASTVSIYERDERNGENPAQLAQLVMQLVEAERVKVRYRVGRMDQTLGIQLKRVLPAGWFEYLMRKIYKFN